MRWRERLERDMSPSGNLSERLSLLFILYVNDLPKILEPFKATLYADDTTITIRDSSVENAIVNTAEAIQKLNEWIKINGLYLNTDKTNAMFFSLRNAVDFPPVLNSINNETIAVTQSVKFLGVIMDNNLSWTDHIDSVCNKIKSYCYALKRLNKTLSIPILLNIYYAYVYFHIQYNVISWGSLAAANSVFKMQKWAARSIIGARKRDTCKPIFKDLNLLTFPCIYIFECALFVKKNMHLFPKYRDGHSHNTRNTLLRLEQHRTSKYEKAPYYASTVIFNKFPTTITDLPINHFKNTFKKFLLGKQYYSVNKFFRITTSFKSLHLLQLLSAKLFQYYRIAVYAWHPIHVNMACNIYVNTLNFG